MCIYSMVLDHLGGKPWDDELQPKYPKYPRPPWIIPFVPYPGQPQEEPTPEEWQKLIDGIKEVKEADKKANEAHCEDPSKGKVIDGLIDKAAEQIRHAMEEDLPKAKILMEMLAELLRIRKELC